RPRHTVHPHRALEGRERAARDPSPCAPQRAAADDHGPGPGSRVSDGRHRRRRGGVRISGHGALDRLRRAESRRALAADVRPRGGCRVRARQLRRRPAVRLARSTDPLRMSARPAALLIGGGILGVVLLVSVLAPWIAPYPATDQHMLDRLKPPGARFLLGPDQYGRGLLSRTLVGARTALARVLVAVGLGLGAAVPIGLTAGYAGGWLDDAIMRIVDAMLAFPSLLLALLVITALGASTTHALTAIGVANAPGVARIVRSAALSLREAEFVLAAQARGERQLYIMFGEVL